MNVNKKDAFIVDSNEIWDELNAPIMENQKKKTFFSFGICILEFKYLINEMFKERILKSLNVFIMTVVYTLITCTVLAFVYINVNEQEDPRKSTLQLFFFSRISQSAIIFNTIHGVFIEDREKRLASLLPERGKIIFSTYSVFISKVLVLFVPKIPSSLIGYTLIYTIVKFL